MKLNKIVATLSLISVLAIAASVMALTQDEVCVDGDPACTASGAHGPNSLNNNVAGHSGFTCAVCHKVGGRLSFDRNGPAYGSGQPAPTFDAAAKTCSNIACHGVPSGTWSYYVYDWGADDYILTTLTIYGNPGGVTPSWYATGAAGCGACHGNPPRNGSSGSNVWHSGNHGGQGPTGAYNQCQFCHPDATGSNGVGTAITNPALHGNGVFNVQATFTSRCFGCH
jgi:predicted CxxxxCH...CXXCH cytochrome family protein